MSGSAAFATFLRTPEDLFLAESGYSEVKRKAP
jgi:hypothetical protein